MNQQKYKTILSHALIWLSLLIFFIYSYQSIMNFEDVSHTGRQKAVIRILAALSRPNLSNNEVTDIVLMKTWETIQIAFLATCISAVLAIPFTFLISKTSTTRGNIINILLQPILSVIRAIHPLITTIFAVVLVGIGPTAGVLSLTLFSTVVLIQKYTEYRQQSIELGWNSLLTVYFPAIAFKYFSINALNASIIGFVGGDGIGFLLQQYINLLNYYDASVALLAVIISIGSLDLLSQIVWRKVHEI